VRGCGVVVSGISRFSLLSSYAAAVVDDRCEYAEWTSVEDIVEQIRYSLPVLFR
jgi:hypothetical protein